MDDLPLSPVSKSFCGYKGRYKIWERQAKGKRQEPFAGRRWQQLPRGPICGTAVAWLCRTARDAPAKFVSAATSSPNYPYGQELGLSNRNCHSDDTVPEKEPHSNHFNLSVAQKPTHCLPVPQQTVEDAILGIYTVWQRPPPMQNSNKISCCFEFFDIPVCRWTWWATTQSAWSFLNETSYEKHVKISNWMCSAICNH